ncbi:MAG: FAD-dependent thymidylate synthase [Chloroflexi bacterium]|nr:FAD-dependent thymidylate synthase [Chloroflexota bacterium]
MRGVKIASVVEHAVLHIAAESLSRLACDVLEDNRLASYTEKSSRYQVLDRGSYHVPVEVQGQPIERVYRETCDALFDAYHSLIERCTEYLKSTTPREEGEKDGAYNLRIRRVVTDHCRFVLPTATLTNVGVTMNARALEHAITKLLSHELAECRELGKRLKEQGQAVAPTLVKYANRSEYLAWTRQTLRPARPVRGEPVEPRTGTSVRSRLVDYDRDAEDRLVTALLYRVLDQPYEVVRASVAQLSKREKDAIVDTALKKLGPFDSPVREAEMVAYTFELEMDYGAYREYRRHRMQTFIPQALTVGYGYVVPPLIEEAGCGAAFGEAMARSAAAYHAVAKDSPLVAEYLVTHAHIVRLAARLNLRECYHLLKLRSASQAHFTIQVVAKQMLQQIRDVHPLLVEHIRLRDA